MVWIRVYRDLNTLGIQIINPNKVILINLYIINVEVGTIVIGSAIRSDKDRIHISFGSEASDIDLVFTSLCRVNLIQLKP